MVPHDGGAKDGRGPEGDAPEVGPGLCTSLTLSEWQVEQPCIWNSVWSELIFSPRARIGSWEMALMGIANNKAVKKETVIKKRIAAS